MSDDVVRCTHTGRECADRIYSRCCILCSGHGEPPVGSTATDLTDHHVWLREPHGWTCASHEIDEGITWTYDEILEDCHGGVSIKYPEVTDG